MDRRQLITRIVIVSMAMVALFIGYLMASNAGLRGEFKARMEEEKAAVESGEPQAAEVATVPPR
jgi:hypothetical protein